MKSTLKASCVVFALSLLLPAGNPAQAASSTWTGTAATGNWTDATWSAGVPGANTGTANTDVATFITSSGSGAGGATITVDANRNVGGITFSGATTTGTSAYTLSGGSLILSSGGTIQSTATAAEVINSSLTLEGNASFLSNATAAGTVQFGGTTITEDTGVTGTLTLGGGNGSANVVNAVMSDGASGGVLSLMKTGAGQWAVGANNTYTGATTVARGTMLINGASGAISKTSSVTVQGGGTLTAGGSGANGLANRINTAATLILGGAYFNGAGTGFLNGTYNIVLGSTTANSQSLASLTVAAGTSDFISTSSSGGGVPTLTFSGATPYVRNTGGFVDLGQSSGLAISFTNAPTGTGNVGGGLLLGAYLGGNGFILAQSGALTGAAYETTTAGGNTASNYTGTNMDVTTTSPTMSGPISINSLRFNAAGTNVLTLTGTNLINSPGILVGSGATGSSTISGGAIETTNGGSELLIYLNSKNLTINSAILDNGGSSLSVGATPGGSGTLTLTGANTYTGVTTIASGATLILGDGVSNTSLGGNVVNELGSKFTVNLANGGSIAGNITSDGTITFTPGSGVTQTLSGAITDGGSGLSGITQSGAGITNLTGGPSTVGTGGVTVSGGTLNASGALSTTGAITESAGTFNISGATSAGSATVSGGLFEITGSGGSLTTAGTVTGTAGTLTISGTGGSGSSFGQLNVGGGTLNLSGNVTAGSVSLGFNGGPETVNITGGTQNWGTSGGFVDLGRGNNVTLTQTGGAVIIPVGVLVGNGATAGTTILNISGGTFDSTNTSGTAWRSDGAVLTLNVTGTGEFSTAGTFTLGGFPSGTLTIANSASVTLSKGVNLGANGTINLNGGTLNVGAPIVGANPSALNFNGGTLNFTATGTELASIAGLTANVQGGGAVLQNALAVTISQALVTNVGSGLDGGLTKLGAGTLTLSGANTYTGATTISAGQIKMATGGTLGATSAALNDNASLDLASTSQGVGALSGSGTILNSTASTTSTLTVGNGNASGTFTGVIENNGGAGGTVAFVMTGTGTEILTGANIYTGITTINSGSTLQLGNGGATGSLSASSAIVDNGTFVINESGNVVQGAGFSSSVLGGSGGFIQAGTGTTTLNLFNTYSGNTTITQGALSFTLGNISSSGAQSLGEGSVVNLGVAGVSSGELIYTGGGTTLAKTINALGNGNDTINNTGSGTLILSGALVKNGTKLTLEGDMNVTGVISGSSSGSDLIIDTGTTMLSNANTYNGPTYIRDNATLEAAVAGALPTSTRSDVIMDDTGSGSSTLALDVSQSISSLTGASSSQVTLGSTTLTVGNSGTGTGTATFAGVISGTGGSVTKDGTSTEILTGANTYTGTTTVSSGTLQLSNSSGSATGSGALNVAAGATLAGKGSSSGSSFSLTGNSSTVATVLVGHDTAGDLNTTGVMSLSATGASSIGSANLVFNLNSNVAGQGNQLSVGATDVVFNVIGSMNTTLTLNLQGAGSITPGTNYVLIAGTTASGGSGQLGSQYTGLDLGTTTVLGSGITQTQILNSNFGGSGSLNLSFGLDNSVYGAGSMLFLYQNTNTGQDYIEVAVVPEPGTWALMLGGLTLLVFIQQRRRRDP